MRIKLVVIVFVTQLACCILVILTIFLVVLTVCMAIHAHAPSGLISGNTTTI